MQTKADTPSPFTRPTAVYMGNLYAEYDHDLIFKAAELLKARGLSPRIEILGSGPEIEKWRAYVRDRGLNNVHVAGFVVGRRPVGRLRHAHVLLFRSAHPRQPSRCPSKTYSYAQARRPIIACRVSEVPEVLGEGSTIRRANAEKFADALAAADGQPAARRRLRHRAAQLGCSRRCAAWPPSMRRINDQSRKTGSEN